VPAVFLQLQTAGAYQKATNSFHLSLALWCGVYACVGIFIPHPAPCDKLIAIKGSFDRVAQIPLNYSIALASVECTMKRLDCKSDDILFNLKLININIK